MCLRGGFGPPDADLDCGVAFSLEGSSVFSLLNFADSEELEESPCKVVVESADGLRAFEPELSSSFSESESDEDALEDEDESDPDDSLSLSLLDSGSGVFVAAFRVFFSETAFLGLADLGFEDAEESDLDSESESESESELEEEVEEESDESDSDSDSDELEDSILFDGAAVF